MWINLLSKGLRIPLLGGNDAHGDFNRYRATSVPFVSIYEGFDRYMGYGKTGVYGKKKTPGEILDSIRKGETFVTTGPFISINRTDSPGESIISNVTLPFHDTSRLFVHAISTPEFGRLLKLSVFTGGPSIQERPVLSKYHKETVYEVREYLPSIEMARNCYLRAEIVSILDDKTLEGYSSPCYFGGQDYRVNIQINSVRDFLREHPITNNQYLNRNKRL
jgi:hypothetical protein